MEWRVLLLLIDAAPYMVKAGNSLNIIYTNMMMYVTCVVYFCNCLAEKNYFQKLIL